MTISNTPRKAGPYAGNGSATTFAFSFKVFSAADVLVVRAVTATGAETTLALTTDYTVSLNADQDTSPGGTITTTTAPATGQTITLSSDMDYTQPVELTNNGGFYPSVINAALDRLTIFAQQLAEQVSRAVKTGISSTQTPDEMLTTISESATTASAAAVSAAASAALAEAAAESATGLPAQTGHAGKVLSTDGSAASWTALDYQPADPDIPTVSASQAEMEAGTETALRSMSPLRVKQAITALASSGQVVSASLGTLATGTTVIPADNTIPQNTEGDQYLSVTVTPKSASSNLVIDVTIYAAHSAASSVLTAALFKDSAASAIAAGMVAPTGASYILPIKFTHVIASGSTSAQTFKVRAGANAAGTTTVNGWAGAQYLGGIMSSSIVVTEVMP